ncbi:hypothetical protein MTR_3g086550 [Medicago truncatula]|uniref:Uncharacterized protein n=1 Tax=Medicago truncatula TaxID=3880 RepID=A0A072V0G3_MEDTR|nr:hypothetical protein MTR_3g086550 [Medicago truncatula]
MVTESDKTATLTMMSNKVRLRLLFDDRNMLSKSKKKEGLKCCWFLLKPHLTTISDLASHILAVFRLHRNCPDGITLSMDGFVLPSFESTCILKDKDIVCVKKKGSMLTGSKPAMLPSETHENQLIELPKLLAIEGFQEKREEYETISEDDDDDNDQSEDVVNVESKLDGNATSKKRKASKKLKSPSKKKIKMSTTENLADIPEAHEEENGSVKDCTHRKASLAKKDIGKSSTLSCQKNDKSGSTSEETRSLQPQDEGEPKKLPSRSARRKKAKRKWLRELKLKEKEKEKEKENENEKDKLHPSQVLEKDDQQIPIKDNNGKVSDVRQQSNEESEADDDMVPVEIRPGHIRFQPRGKDLAAPENQLPVDTFQWNGTTSKKKGQKWGKERTSSHKQDDYEPSSQDGHAAQWRGTVSKKDPKWGKERTSSHKQNDYEQSSQDGRTVQWSGTASKKKDQIWGKGWTSSHKQDDHEQSSQDRPTVQRNGTISKDQKWGKEKTSAHKHDHEQSSQDRPTVQWNGTISKDQKWGKEKTSAHKQDDCEQSSQDRPTDQNAGKKRTFDAVDFEKLTPYTDLPKEGNVIAYRLIELSESWTPELSSFRVGKTTQYDSKSNRIWLQPVSEFPFDFWKKIDDMDEDGSPSQSDPSPYQEDGSLEIDYASLADVRIIKHGHSDLATVVAHSDAFVTPTKATNNSTDEKPADNETAAGSSKPQIEGHVTAKGNVHFTILEVHDLLYINMMMHLHYTKYLDSHLQKMGKSMFGMKSTRH